MHELIGENSISVCPQMVTSATYNDSSLRSEANVPGSMKSILLCRRDLKLKKDKAVEKVVGCHKRQTFM